MKLSRKQFLHLVAGTGALPALPRIASAQTYPTRPVRIIVGFPAGGPNDFHARLMAQWLSDRLGQQFVVENRPGVGGNTSTEAVVRAPPDGYTLLLTSSPDAINATLYDNFTFNFLRLLRARRKRPSSRRSADKRDEFAASHCLSRPRGRLQSNQETAASGMGTTAQFAVRQP
jgi:hypothetical protein